MTHSPASTVAPPVAHPLDPCVHCGFCLPACPTYVVTGDEADSPRGRIVLMRALERGEVGTGDAALREHLDACLGCRGCEPVCPSGVEYGRGLELARVRIAREQGHGVTARALLAVFAREWLWRPVFTVGRWMRRADRGPGGSAARRLGGWTTDGGVAERVRGAARMLAATAPAFATRAAAPPSRRAAEPRPPTVALFRGCVMDTLFSHVHDATRRVLEANGYTVVEAPGQTCCGALHEHAGDRATAQRLAERNVRALADAADWIVVDSAGCGAVMKDYGHLVGEQGGRADEAGEPGGSAARRLGDAARRMSAKVRDVTELLIAVGPRTGAPLELDVAYDAPCHLQHAQRVQAEPLGVLAAIPGLRVQVLPGSSMCCGSAGIYSIVEPDMSQRVLEPKIAELAAAVPRPSLVVTGNPGCLMQIGAGLAAAGLDMRAAHPVELLDESYARAGMYGW